MSVGRLLRWYACHGLFRPLRKSAYRKLCRRERGSSHVVDLPDGQRMRTIIGDSVDDRIYVYREYEPQVTALIRHLVGRCGAFVDVGCNIGYFSCLAGRTNPGARLVAIDPNPRMIERTQENLGLNGIGGATLVNVGIGASNRTMTLYVPRDRHSLSSLAYRPERGAKGGVDAIEVEVRRLFEAVPATGGERILLKVDAEGFEYEVFSGVTAAESARLDFVVFELSARNLAQAGLTVQQVLSVPWFADFDLFTFDAGDRLVPAEIGRIEGMKGGEIVMARKGLTSALAPFLGTPN